MSDSIVMIMRLMVLVINVSRFLPIWTSDAAGEHAEVDGTGPKVELESEAVEYLMTPQWHSI